MEKFYFLELTFRRLSILCTQYHFNFNITMLTVKSDFFKNNTTFFGDWWSVYISVNDHYGHGDGHYLKGIFLAAIFISCLSHKRMAGFNAVDYLVFFAVLVVSLGIGVLQAFRGRWIFISEKFKCALLRHFNWNVFIKCQKIMESGIVHTKIAKYWSRSPKRSTIQSHEH